MSDNLDNYTNEIVLDDPEFTKIRRRKLLPTWIQIFCWIFMLFGPLSIVCLFLGMFGLKPQLAFYGFETNEVFSLNGLIVISVGVLKGFTAFSLWFEKDYAIKLAKIETYIGIVLCIISMLVLPFLNENFKLTIRLELILLIPFLLKMKKIQYAWENN
jgi:accessory gene regulator protein AgrB